MRLPALGQEGLVPDEAPGECTLCMTPIFGIEMNVQENALLSL